MPPGDELLLAFVKEAFSVMNKIEYAKTTTDLQHKGDN